MKSYYYSFKTERLFNENGPFFHVCSKPAQDVIFRDSREKSLAILYMALAALESGTGILAYNIMSNHVHVILHGLGARDFYDKFVAMFNNYLRRHGRKNALLPVEPTIVPINNLIQFREEVAYVLRNKFVVDVDENLFLSPSCSGYLYFNPQLEAVVSALPYSYSDKMSKRKVMQITLTTDGTLPPGLKFFNDNIAPSCFVEYTLVERLFGNARQFVFSMFKNVESQVEVAARVKEEFFMPDEEAFKVAWKFSHTTWAVDELKQLSPVQKRELAKHMKLTYYSSNGQLVRVTGLSKSEVDAMFPLSANPDRQ